MKTGGLSKNWYYIELKKIDMPTEKLLSVTFYLLAALPQCLDYLNFSIKNQYLSP